MRQMIGTFVHGPLPGWAIVLYQVVTLLSYTNSAINPALYAFLTDNFRRTLAESIQRGSRTTTSSVVARGLAMCGNVLYVSVQEPIRLSRLADRASINDSLPSPAELRVDAEERNGDSSDANSAETMSRALSTSIWIEHCRQSQTVELHAVCKDSVGDQSPRNESPWYDALLQERSWLSTRVPVRVVVSVCCPSVGLSVRVWNHFLWTKYPKKWWNFLERWA